MVADQLLICGTGGRAGGMQQTGTIWQCVGKWVEMLSVFRCRAKSRCIAPRLKKKPREVRRRQAGTNQLIQ
jgi:hypothetical protein